MVRGLGLELGRAGVHRYEGGLHPGGDAGSPHLACRHPPQVAELLVGEPELLGPLPGPAVHAVEAALHQRGPLLGDLEELVAEPGVHLSGLEQLLHGDPSAQQGLELEDALGGGHRGGSQQLSVAEAVVGGLAGVGVEAVATQFQRAQPLLERLGEGAGDGHDLAHRLHLGVEHPRNPGELLERPPGHLGDHVVDDRLEAGWGLLGDVVGNLVEGVAHGQAGGDLGDGKPSGLGGQRGGPRHPGVHLDDHELAGLGIHRELDVGAAGLDPYPADAGKGGVAQRLVLHVGKGLGGGHGDGVAGVDPHRVEVLDGADHHAVVSPVAHHLELVLLPAGDGLLDEDFADGTGGQAGGGHLAALLGGVGDAGAGAAQDVGRADDHRQADALHDLHSLVEGVGGGRGGHGQADVDHGLAELGPVLGGGDGVLVGADHLHPVLVHHPRLDQLHGQVEGGLAAQGGQQNVGLLPVDDAGEHLGAEGFHVGGIGELGVGHDGGRVGVGQHHPVALVAQHPAGLGAGVVELAGLADDDGARPDEQDRLDVGPLRHRCPPSIRRIV